MIHSEPSGGTTATRGSTVILTVSSGPKLAKVPVLVGTPALGRGPADPRPRPRPRASPKKRARSPAGEVIRQSPSAGSQAAARLDRLDRRLQGRSRRSTVPNVIGKELRPKRWQALREAGPQPDRAGTGNRSRLPRSAASPTSSRRRARRSNPGAEVTVVVGKPRPNRRPRPTGRSRTRRRRGDEGRGALAAGAPPSTTSRCARARRWRAGWRRPATRRCAVTIARDGRWSCDGAAGRADSRRRACSAPTPSSRPCTGPSARTAASRACSSGSTSPTSAPTCSPRRSAWTS